MTAVTEHQTHAPELAIEYTNAPNETVNNTEEPAGLGANSRYKTIPGIVLNEASENGEERRDSMASVTTAPEEPLPHEDRPNNHLSVDPNQYTPHRKGHSRFASSDRSFSNLPQRAKASGKQLWAQLMNAFRKMKKENEEVSVTDIPITRIFESGTPAALFPALFFLHNQSGESAMPMLMDLVKIRVLDVEPNHKRIHTLFTVQVQYGSGPKAIRWLIHRELLDFLSLHSHFLFLEFSHHFYGKRFKLPKFPKEALPYLRKLRGFNYLLFNKDHNGQLADDVRSMSNISVSGSSISSRSGKSHAHQRSLSAYWISQRMHLERYLQEMCSALQFLPELNIYNTFLELSMFGLRLAGDGNFHGKEGYAYLKKNFSPAQSILCCNGPTMKSRPKPFWIIVSQSYIVFTDSPLSLEPLDVFIWDADFEITQKDFRSKHSKDVNRATLYNSTHNFKMKNRERVMKLEVRNHRWLKQFMNSIQVAQGLSSWCELQRFDSYAPVRTNVAAQWLVDGRDHAWNISRAIMNAKECIYIHDWWLSPELYMRRPVPLATAFRLDRLIQKKAEEGVMVYVMIYRNIDATVPIDSFHTKAHLQLLHPNIYVIRSPSHLRQSTLFWAHHEKLLVIDNIITFIGGIDLCFGRYDTSQHILRDDKNFGFDGESDSQRTLDNAFTCQTWPGKDYSNPRIHDFFDLTHPYKTMYDRNEITRMGWHDVSMCILGQPARDAARHFVQRWNYLIRCKRPARKTPLLIPPPDFTKYELQNLQLTGTCEVQVLRSAGLWSLGLVDTIETSIQNAYVSLIENSEHFIYIENQFFVTSTVCEGTIVENRIGDALVERIIRAEKNKEKWRAVVIIPLLPGFEGEISQNEGSSLRLIVECQYKSICRGDTSIYGRLKKCGIDGSKYLRFYGLRGWTHNGPHDLLYTELVYVHGKVMIADDRVAVIGSANINERSLLGNRDSEIAAVVRDTLMEDSLMDGKPYKVGKFAHRLRIRLMREHLGIETDVLEQREYNMDGLDRDTVDKRMQVWNPQADKGIGGSMFSAEELELRYRSQMEFQNSEELVKRDSRVRETLDRRVRIKKLQPAKNKPNTNEYRREKETACLDANALVGGIPPCMRRKIRNQFDFSKFPGSGEDQRPLLLKDPEHPVPEPSRPHCGLGLAYEDTDKYMEFNPFTKKEIPKFTADSFTDPVSEEFFENTWCAIAESNTVLYRNVFRCMPDDCVKTWDEYHEWRSYIRRFPEAQMGWLEEETPSDSLQAIQKQPSIKSGEGSTQSTKRSSAKKETLASQTAFKFPTKQEATEWVSGVRGHLVEFPLDWMLTEDENKKWLFGFDKIPPLDIYD
ncbi:phospholipase D [Schizosaccharomyces japonicus yFS275]|uniref:Phospholipase n=1 Tax=Schizosaccharomyces japonicus (strain yFS275 / FY16936) TaxID=402676 RepID=B6JY60_SCHJY|nr:phospholipase D [Schizosaccharomyces japonicus yFS275]EEB06478.2 phospholipase D [Schizosaccharomyces japonicus yFS275]